METGDSLSERQDNKIEVEKIKAELNLLSTELDIAKQQSTRLQDELAKERRLVKTIKNTLSFQLGNLLIKAVRKPGHNTILLPYRLVQLGIGAIRKIIIFSSPRSARKAHVLEEIREMIAIIKRNSAASNKSRIEPRRKDLKMAVIMDKFSLECFKYEADLITFTPENWEKVLSMRHPDLLLVESAWQGNDSSWRYQIVNLESKPQSKLMELVQWCRINKIPAVFWNKEDPLHYPDFLCAAKLFDYVFTTDSDCMDRYKKDLGHDNVFCLPFAVQPKIHNPVGSEKKIRGIAFAGSWYEGQNEFRMERKEQMANILIPALSCDVDIYDRHFTVNDKKYTFPKQYQPYIVGELPYDEMVYAYRLYNVFLNVSTVSDSPTMFPRRVLEILASGTCVLSGRSKGIENLIGSDIVTMSNSRRETELQLKKLLASEDLRDRLALSGLRKVMKEHTYDKRLDSILKILGIGKNKGNEKNKGVSVITCTNKLYQMNNIFSNYDRQQYTEKELIIVLNNNLLNMEKWVEETKEHHNATVYRIDEKEGLGSCLNSAIEKARFEYIAKFDDDDYYAPAYLGDMMAAFDYSGADIVGKKTYYMYFKNNNVLALRFPGKEHCFTNLVSGATMVVNLRVFDQVKFDSQKERGSDTRFQKECLQKGFFIYSSDRFNFAAVRGAITSSHTWQANDDDLLSNSKIVCCTEDYINHIIC